MWLTSPYPLLCGVWLSSIQPCTVAHPPLFHSFHHSPLFVFSSFNFHMATTTPFNLTSLFPRNYYLTPPLLLHHHSYSTLRNDHFAPLVLRRRITTCKATEVSLAEESSASGGENWVPVVPLGALPRGERRVIIQDGETILLLWYKDEVFAIENRSPAEGAYSEGLLNAKLTKV